MGKQRGAKKNIVQQCLMLLLAIVLSAVIVGQMVARAQEEKQAEQEQLEQIELYQQEIVEKQEQIQQEKLAIDKIQTDYDSRLQALKDQNVEFYNLYRKYTDDLDQHRKLAGLTSVQGAGIIIRMDDSGLVQGAMIHDTYLLETINVLKEAGAQAISVNGQRVLATTEILCLGPSIRINDSREFAPYHIYAVGDPNTLMETYRNSSIYRTITAQNLICDVQSGEQITVNAYSGNYASLITKLFAQETGTM